MRRLLLIALLSLGGAACTELGDETPFPHRDPPSDARPADAGPADARPPDAGN